MNVNGVSGVCASNAQGDLYSAKGTMDDRSAAILAQVLVFNSAKLKFLNLVEYAGSSARKTH